MPNEATLRMLKMYEERSTPQPFLQTLFKTPQENYHDSEKLTVDSVRGEPRIAVPNPEGSFGTRKVELSKYVNKEWVPAVYDLETSISAFNAFKRLPGQDPFAVGSDSLRNIVQESFRYVRELDAMVQRGVELQCAQVLTTGRILLKDKDNLTVFDLDFGIRVAHLVTTTAWSADGTTGDPGGDVESLAEQVSRNGKADVDQAIFGRGALLRFMANAKIRDGLDKLNLNVGSIDQPKSRGGATYHGRVVLGTRIVELWSYRATYIDPVTGNHTPYIPDNKVVVRASDGRLDLTFGSIPTIVPPDARVAQFLPPRMSNPARGFDASLNAWVTPDGKHLQLSVGTRALAIPTAPDTFGCLTVY